MAKRKSNEWEFQGQVLTWINDQISRRPGLGLDKATQEPSKISPKRSDLVIWWNREAGSPFFTVELKTPELPITDPKLLSDASEKATRWGAPCFAIWNMQTAELYKTPTSGPATPADRVHVFPLNPLIGSVDDWLDAKKEALLKADAINIFETAWERFAVKSEQTVEIEASVFVDKLKGRLERLRYILIQALSAKAAKPAVRIRLKQLAAEQGFSGFVESIDAAIAGQYAYRLMGQVLFYFALKKRQPTLKALEVPGSAQFPAALRPFWDDVRRFDYEALFKESELESLVPFPPHAETVLRQMIEELSHYDWNKLRDDVLGAVFENLIPRSEQILLGQFYTPTKVADLLVAFAVDADGSSSVLDPGCGSGTFVMRAYEYLRDQTGQSHADVLSRVWGFDISAFATELASINLFRQDMSVFDNFPRIFSGNFFERFVGEELPFPPAKAGGQDKVMIDIPQFQAVVANPPYLRSQNQDDLDEKYKNTLFAAAVKNSVKAASKTDLFAFFMYKTLEFLEPGGRLGFVVSASWLTAEFGATLQQVLLERFKLLAIVGSRVESFFSQVAVNTVLIVAERRAGEKCDAKEIIRFVTLKRKLEEVLGPKIDGYWKGPRTS
jgi:methylase of polypeptide subunit release factors